MRLHHAPAAPFLCAVGGVSPPVLKGVGITAPFGNAADGTCWDPVGFTERTEDSLMLWYRAAELKHSRVAMLACAGWIVNGLHLSLPGTIDYETKFSDLAALPPLPPSVTSHQ